MLFHHSFAEWLLDVKHCTQKYLCSAIEGHAMLAVYYTLRACQLSADEICVLGQHLQRAMSTVGISNCSLDVHTLQVLWIIGSGAPVQECYLDSSDCILWPRQDTKLLRLLVDAGAKPSEKAVEDEVSKEVVSSSQVKIIVKFCQNIFSLLINFEMMKLRIIQLEINITLNFFSEPERLYPLT